MPLRSTMSEERLPSLAVLHVHKHKEVNRTSTNLSQRLLGRKIEDYPCKHCNLLHPIRHFTGSLLTLSTDRLKTFVRGREGLSCYSYIVHFLNKSTKKVSDAQ